MTRYPFMAAVCAAALVLSADAGQARDGQRPSFEDIDANGDGEITRSELMSINDGRFDDADTNGDGALDRDEMIASSQARAEKRVDRAISRLDTNDDGVLSREELSQRRDPGRVLARFDADDSGTLSKSEFDALQEKFASRRGARGHSSD